jgi:hypothetical protein
MAVTLKNGDRLKLERCGPIPEARFNGGFKLTRGRSKDGKFKSTYCYIDTRELRASKGKEQWTPLAVFRWYKGVLQSMLDFGVTHGWKKFAEQREGVPVSEKPQEPAVRGQKRLTGSKKESRIAPLQLSHSTDAA